MRLLQLRRFPPAAMHPTTEAVAKGWAQPPVKDWSNRETGAGLHAAALHPLALLVLVWCLAVPAARAQEADLWDRWTVHDSSSTATIDHSRWDDFLRTYVVVGDDGINRVAYRWVTEADEADLGAYIERLAATSISSYARPEQRAFWINLYNALTVQLILDHYPVDSILDIDLAGGFWDNLFGDGPWQRKLIAVEGAELSLADIENRILRPIWEDPRLHYAVNRAALGCPNLQAEAFTARNTDALLEAAARAFVNHPRGVAIVDDELVVSSLYLRYEEDFGGDEVSVIAHLRRYASAALSRALMGRTEIDDDAYDWSLNDMR